MSYPLVVSGVGSSTSVTGFSRQAYRWRLAPMLGYHWHGVSTAVAAGFEPERYAISLSHRSDFAKPDRFDELFFYVNGGALEGSQRMLVPGGYDGPNGALMLDYPLDSVLPSGSGIEISVLPAEDYLGYSGLNGLINLGLELLPIIDLLDIVATESTIEYPLVTYPWPIREIGRLYQPRTAATFHRVEVGGVRLRMDANTPILVLPYSFTAGDSFTIEVLRPASTWIQQSGVWGDSTEGLTSDEDRALYDVRTLVNAAFPIALERYAQCFPEGTKERAAVENKIPKAEVTAGVSRFFGGFRGDGVQRVGARSNRRTSWWWNN